MHEVAKSIQTHRTPIILAVSFIGLLVGAVESAARWSVKTKGLETVSVGFSIRYEGLRGQTGFYFPEYSHEDEVLTVGFEPIEASLESVADTPTAPALHSWKHTFQMPVRVILGRTFLTQRLYLEGVRDFTVSFHAADSKTWYSKTFSPSYGRYQEPLINRISEWENESAEDLALVSEQASASTIDTLVVTVRPTAPNYRFVIGDFQIGDKVYVEGTYHHPLFDPLVGEDHRRLLAKGPFFQPPGQPIVQAAISQYSMFGNFSQIFYLESDDSISLGELRAFQHAVFERMIELYPFYAERRLEKKTQLARFHAISETDVQDVFEDSLKALIADFQDIHFAIEDRSAVPCRFNRPLALRRINGVVQVAAVFDSILAKRVQPGAIVIEMDGRPIERVVDSLATRYAGDATVRDRKAIRDLLLCRLTPDTRLTLLEDKESLESYMTDIDVTMNSGVPSNFVPMHCEFRQLSAGISYFRIARWDLASWTRFLNNAEELSRADGIVIDLRANAGGDGRSVLRFLSVFIDSVTVCTKELCPADGAVENVAIHPHPRFGFKDTPVVILTDAGTACASEHFIDVMKNAVGATIVGSSKTQGAFTPRITLVFPDGLVAHANSWSVPKSPWGTQIEGTGIMPDVLVSIETPSDLAHSEDKVLHTAHRLLMSTQQ